MEASNTGSMIEIHSKMNGDNFFLIYSFLNYNNDAMLSRLLAVFHCCLIYACILINICHIVTRSMCDRNITTGLGVFRKLCI